MLIEFSVANFRSINERQTLSMVADSAGELRATNVMPSSAPSTPELVRSAVIYGANAAGKSNVLAAFEFVDDFILNSARESQAGDPIRVMPFRFGESGEKPSEFEILFVQGGVRYQYGFHVTNEEVIAEWLVAYPGGRPQRWLDRRRDLYTFGAHLKGSKNSWKTATRPNALFLSTATQLNSEQLAPLFEWFGSRCTTISSELALHDRQSAEFCAKSDIDRERVASFLRVSDLGIQDVQVRHEGLSFDATELGQFGKGLRSLLEPRLITRFAHRTPSGNQVLLELDDESRGTRKLFAITSRWLQALDHGHVIIADELDTSLHPFVTRHIVQMFHDPKINTKGAQLVFTTHDTSILDPTLFRRDQIWFVEKDQQQQSRLYPLTDFSPRKGENFEKGYLQGRYGAVPFLGEFRL